MRRTHASSFLLLCSACGQGIDLLYFGSRSLGQGCTSDVECEAGLRCDDGLCVPPIEHTWQWGDEREDDSLWAMDRAADGSVYLAGGTLGRLAETVPAGNQDPFVIRLAPTGIVDWIWRPGTAEAEAAHTVTVTPWNTVVVSGYTHNGLGWGGHQGGSDFWVAEVDTQRSVSHRWVFGTELEDWPIDLAVEQNEVDKLRMWGGANKDFAQDVRVDEAGTIYAAGGTESGLVSPTRSMDIFLLREPGW